MIKRFLILTLLFASPAVAHDAPEWTIDPAHSSVSFSIRHIFSPIVGTFSPVSGTLRFDRANLKGSRVSVTIPIAGINTRVDRRDTHLRTADFFDAEKFPNMTFVGDTFIRRGKDQYTIVGDLTIRGITRRVRLPFKLHGIKDHPSRENHFVAGATAELTIKRSHFGVGTGRFAETAVIGDEVKILLGIEAFRPK